MKRTLDTSAATSADWHTTFNSHGKIALEQPASPIPSPTLSVRTRLAMERAVSLDLRASPAHGDFAVSPADLRESRASPRYCATRTWPEDPRDSGQRGVDRTSLKRKTKKGLFVSRHCALIAEADVLWFSFCLFSRLPQSCPYLTLVGVFPVSGVVETVAAALMDTTGEQPALDRTDEQSTRLRVRTQLVGPHRWRGTAPHAPTQLRNERPIRGGQQRYNTHVVHTPAAASHVQPHHERADQGVHGGDGHYALFRPERNANSAITETVGCRTGCVHFNPEKLCCYCSDPCGKAAAMQTRKTALRRAESM